MLLLPRRDESTNVGFLLLRCDSTSLSPKPSKFDQTLEFVAVNPKTRFIQRNGESRRFEGTRICITLVSSSRRSTKRARRDF